MTITMDDSDYLSSDDKFDKMAAAAEEDFDLSVEQLPDNRELENERSRMLIREEFQLNDTALKNPPRSARKITQIMAVLAVSFGAYIHGTTVVYPAVAIPSLKKSNGSVWSNETTEDAVLPFLITDDDISLIVSIAAFGMLMGSLIAGPIANLIGRKWTSIFGTCGCLASSYALIAGAQWLWMLLLGRFLHGTGLGFSTTVSTIYIMEVATPDLRGRLAVVPAIAGTLGVITCHILGAFLNWQLLAVVFASLNVPFFLLLLFIPETPVYLIGKNKIETAHKILRIFRGKNWDVTKELTNIKNASESEVKQKVRIRDLWTRSVIVPFIIALVLMFFFQFTGINIILQFTVEIFQTAQSSVDEFQATIFVGVALLVSNGITLMVADKMPRRSMLILSSLGISLSLIGMGVQFYLKTLEKMACAEAEANAAVAEKLTTDGGGLNGLIEDDDDNSCPAIYTGNLGWLPLLILMIYIFFFNLGFGAMIWITVAEILPLRVRSVLTSLAVGFTCVMSFLTSHTYNDMKETMQLEGVFWLYGAFSFLGLIFIVIWVPETKGKSESEIQAHFLPKSKERETGKK